MKSRLFAALIVALTLAAAPALAREPVPIVNHDNIPVATASGKAPAVEQVKHAILLGAGAKGWIIAEQSDGQLLATLNVRGKHIVAVTIAYSGAGYSLRYHDSVNMKYGYGEGGAVIHPFYNKWVLGLREAIRVELLKI